MWIKNVNSANRLFLTALIVPPLNNVINATLAIMSQMIVDHASFALPLFRIARSALLQMSAPSVLMEQDSLEKASDAKNVPI